MQNKSENSQINLIIKDRKQLHQTLLELCEFTLTKIGFQSDLFAFDLHIALRRNIVLKPELFDFLNADYPWTCKGEHLEKLTEFTQVIVNEIQEAEKKPWALKLVENQYLGYLDKARNETELALTKLETYQSELGLVEEPERNGYLETFRAHIAYTDTLLALPFVLENFCNILMRKGAIYKNYQPKKSALMLTSVLDTIHAYSPQNEILLSLLKLAIETALPDIPLESRAIEAITNNLLPFINKVIDKKNAFEKAQAKLFSTDKEAVKCLLDKALNIRFYTLSEIIENTLLKPAVVGLQGLSLATLDSFDTFSQSDRFKQFAFAFSHFDNLCTLGTKDENVLPQWLRIVNQHYQQMKTAASTVKDGISYVIDRIRGNPEEKKKLELAYLEFYDLSKKALAPFSVNVHFFFTAFMGKWPNASYFDYKQFLELHTADLQALDKYLSEHVDYLLLEYRLLKLQNAFEDNSESVENIVLELLKASEIESQFKQNKLIPVMETISLSLVKKHYLPLLQDAIDNPERFPHKGNWTKLKPLYNEIMSNCHLTEDDLQFLWEVFPQDHSIHKLALAVKPNKNHKTKHKTPNQKIEKVVKLNIPLIKKTLGSLQTKLDEQIGACKALQSLCQESRNLNSIYYSCHLKIEYILAIKDCIGTLEIEIEKDKAGLAKKIRKIVTGEIVQELQTTLASVDNITSKLLSFAWQVMPAANDIVHETILNNLLKYCCQPAGLEKIIKLGQVFNDNLAQDGLPLFMEVLGDPLSSANLIPKQEELLDGVVDSLIKTGVGSLGGWLADKTLDLIAPAFICNTLKYVIESEEVHNLLQPYIHEYLDAYTDSAKQLVKDKLYPLLGVEMRKSAQLNALLFAKDWQSKSKNPNSDSLAFALYYLQYNSIREEAHGAFDITQCLLLLFPNLKPDEHLLFGKIFIEVDRLLEKPQDTDLLYWLISTLNFEAETDLQNLKLILINRQLLSILDFSNNKQEAIDALCQLLEECAGAEQNQLDSTSSMLSTLAAPLKRSAELNKVALQRQGTSLKEKIQSAIRHREAIRDADDPRLAGRMVVDVEWEQANALRKLYYFIKLGASLYVPLLFFPALVGATSVGVADIILKYLGLMAVFGASANPVAISIFSITISLFFLINLITTLLKALPEFKNIINSEDPLWKKGLSITWLCLKCLGLALVKTVFLDFIIKKIKALIPTGPVEEIARAVNRYPTVQRLNEEIEALNNLDRLATKLETNNSKGLRENFLTTLDNSRLKIEDPFDTRQDREEFTQEYGPLKACGEELIVLAKKQEILQQKCPENRPPCLKLSLDNPEQALAKVDVKAWYDAKYPVMDVAPKAAPEGFFARFFARKKADAPKDLTASAFLKSAVLIEENEDSLASSQCLQLAVIVSPQELEKSLCDFEEATKSIVLVV